MAKAFVGRTSGTANNGGNITITLNSGLTGGTGSAVSTGDMVIVGGASGGNGVGLAFPGDWTVIDNGTTGGGNSRGIVAYKIMGATPDTSVTLTGDGSNFSSVGAIAHVMSGCDYDSSVTPTTATSTGSTDPDPPSITPDENNTAVFAWAFSRINDASITVPTNYSNLTTINSGGDTNDVTLALAWRDGRSSGVAEDPGVFGTWSSGAWRTVSFCVKDSSSAPTGTIAQTLPKLAQAAVAVMHAAGTIAQTLPSADQAAVGTERFTGTVAQVLPSVDQAATGAEVFSGTGAQTLPNLEQAATGTEVFTGTVAQVLPRLAQAASGALTVAGTIAQTLARLVQAAVGDGGAAAEEIVRRTWSAMRRRLRGSRRRR